MLTEATQANLERKAHWADHVQVLKDGTPLFSWLDLSITELCNRSAGSPKACVFCPRIDPEFYPNQKLHMSLGLACSIANQLKALKYEGAIVLSGFGEPMLHPHIVRFVEIFRGLHIEIVTNGDRLNARVINDLYDVGLSMFVVSMYDGPHQVKHFEDMFDEASADPNAYLLRDRWYDESEDFGLKLTNRAGTIGAGHQKDVDMYARCYYPSYSMSVDWNGDVLLCVQDWNKRLRFGNLNSITLLEAWKNKALHKRRMELIGKGRKSPPCSACNADGCLHGDGHAKAWLSA